MQKAQFIKWLIGFLGFFCSTGFAQPVFISIPFANPSFEGVPNPGNPPPSWRICYPSGSSSPDTQPGYYGVFTPASEGHTFLGMISRDDGSYEAVAQDLSSPLKRDVHYCFSVDLGFNDEHAYEIRKPGIVRIWGVTDLGSCYQNSLLWSSPAINHTDWRTYEVCFTPYQDYGAILIDSYYAQLPFYNGQVILDNLSPVEYLKGWEENVCVDDSTLVNAYPSGEGTGWQVTWKKNAVVKADTITNQLWLKEAGVYLVEIKKGNRVYTANLTLTSQECEKDLLLPNVITPNGDGKNDVFQIQGLLRGNWSVEIYNRWGKRIYANPAYHDEWKGEENSPGIYYYQLQNTKGDKTYKGYIQVVK